MAAPPAGARLLDLQEAVAIRAQCSLPDVLRLHLASQLQLMTDTGLISVVNMQQLACSPAILQQYQQQQHLLTSLAAPHFSMPLATAAPSPWSFSNPGPSDIGDDAHTVHSFDSNLTSQSAMTTDAVLPPISTILGTAATNTDPFTCYPSTSSASQSLQQTQDPPFSLDTVHATTATAADSMLHFTPTLLSQADCQPIKPVTHHPTSTTAVFNVKTASRLPVSPALHGTQMSDAAAADWDVDCSEEMLAQLDQVLRQASTTLISPAQGDISHTKTLAELDNVFDRYIDPPAAPIVSQQGPWQRQPSAHDMTQPQLDLSWLVSSFAVPQPVMSQAQPRKQGSSALSNLVAFDMADCSNPMPLCRSQPQDFRATCTTQSCTSSQSTASTTIVQQSLPIVSTLEQPKVDVSVRQLVQSSTSSLVASSRPSSGAKKRSKRRPRVSSSTTCSSQQATSPTALPKAKVPSAIGRQSAESVGECTSLLPHKRSKTSRQLSTIADNERRRVANMSPTRLEHVRQLSREAARRRKNRQRQTMKQLERTLIEMDIKQRELVAERAVLEKERQQLFKLVQKARS